MNFNKKLVISLSMASILFFFYLKKNNPELQESGSKSEVLLQLGEENTQNKHPLDKKRAELSPTSIHEDTLSELQAKKADFQKNNALNRVQNFKDTIEEEAYFQKELDLLLKEGLFDPSQEVLKKMRELKKLTGAENAGVIEEYADGIEKNSTLLNNLFAETLREKAFELKTGKPTADYVSERRACLYTLQGSGLVVDVIRHLSSKEQYAYFQKVIEFGEIETLLTFDKVKTALGEECVEVLSR